MFGSRDQQLADLEEAYVQFVECVRGLTPEGFLGSLGDWAPRDIVAHFIGWNRITLVGCGEIREGAEPFYFHNGTNDYREVNAGFFRHFSTSDREELLTDIAVTKGALVSYLKTVSEGEWERDMGVVHYRGGPATVARCVDSLIRDYRKHREEIAAGGKA
jgi:hypothetical protein